MDENNRFETTTSRPLVILKKGREQSLSRYHLWVFSRAIAQTIPIPQLGDLVTIVDAQGKNLATGTWEGGNIAVRILQFANPLLSEQKFFTEKLLAAYELRKQLGVVNASQTTTATANENNIYRLVYGEADGLSGLIIDIYGKTAVIQAHSVGMYNRIELIKEALLSIRELSISAVFDKSSSTMPINLPNGVGDRYIHGKRIEVPLYENGLRFIADIEKGQKTGFFIDQRDNRRLVERFAKNRNVLNCFCYTGGFSVYALRGGASEVYSLDSSSRALDVAKQTVELNFDEEISQKHHTINYDAFEYLNSLKGNEYNLIVLDPPAFAKRRDSIRNACNGYRKLNAAALRKIAPQSFLFTFSCSQLVSPYDFRMAVLTAAVESKRSVRIIKQLQQSTCHPINIFHPESEYLKGLLLYVE